MFSETVYYLNYMSVRNVDPLGITPCLWSVSFQSHSGVMHWLPVPQHVRCKMIATLVYKAHHDSTPWYITDLTIPSTSVTRREGMRSSKLSLIVPRHHNKFAELALQVHPSGTACLRMYTRNALTLTEFPKSTQKTFIRRPFLTSVKRLH